MPADQVRGSAARAPLINACLKCACYPFVIGEAEVVITAKVQQLPAGHGYFPPLRRIDYQSSAIKMLFFALLQFLLQVVEIGQGNDLYSGMFMNRQSSTEL